MKRLSVAMLIVVIPWLLAAQECRYGINEVDDHTGFVIKKTLGVIESNVIGATGFINFLKIDSTYYLQFNKCYDGCKEYIVPEGSKFELKLSNRETIEFLVSERYVGDVTETPQEATTSLNIKMKVREKDIKKLTEQKVIRYRVSLSEGCIEDNIRPRFQQNVRMAANCILK
jgi:hypothetical protein